MAAVHPSSDSQQAGHAKEDVVKTSVVTHKSGPPYPFSFVMPSDIPTITKGAPETPEHRK